MLPQQSSQEPLHLTGLDLTIEEVISVARERRAVAIDAAAAQRVRCCREMVDELVARGEKVYGLTTGFGKLRDVSIAERDLERLQINLIRSHSCGVGPAFDEDVVRAAILLRANTLCRGNSGIRLEAIEGLVALLNDQVFPFVPERGSVGASGDLAPLSHLSLVLAGDPAARVLPPGARRGAEIMRQVPVEAFVPLAELKDGWAPTFRPVELKAKEGLALNNGTQIMAALGCLLIQDVSVGLEWAELAVAMSLEAHRGVRYAFQPELHAVRDLSHQGDTAARILAHTEGSEILDVLLNTASLVRARTYLRDAREHLDRQDLHQIDEGIAALLAELEGFLPPSGADGDDELLPDPPRKPELLAQAGRPPREQIDNFEHLMAPLRRRATQLLYALDADGMPAAPLAREALAKALGALSHAVPAAPPVQDDYSLRCAPQVVACAHRALAHAREVFEVEINAATDNPLLFPPEPPGGFQATTPEDYRTFLQSPEQAAGLPERVLGGGNFHGEPLALVLDYLAIALAEVGNISERRTAQLVDEALSNGLPAFLHETSGLNSGFMIPQYTAAALVSENKVLCHPASVDSIPTCAGSEDHVSMGTIAGRKACWVLDNVLHVLAIELLAAYQGLSFRRPLRPGQGVARARAFLQEHGFAPVHEDRALADDLRRLRGLLAASPPRQG